MKEIKYYGLCYFEWPEVKDIYFTDRESAFAFIRKRAIIPNVFHRTFVKDDKIFVVKFVLKEGEYIKCDKSEKDPDDVTYRYGFIYDIKSIIQYVAQDGELILKDKNAKLYLDLSEFYTDGDYLFYDKSIDITRPHQFCTDWYLDEKEFSDKISGAHKFPFVGIIISTDINEMTVRLMEEKDD